MKRTFLFLLALCLSGSGLAFKPNQIASVSINGAAFEISPIVVGDWISVIDTIDRITDDQYDFLLLTIRNSGSNVIYWLEDMSHIILLSGGSQSLSLEFPNFPLSFRWHSIEDLKFVNRYWSSQFNVYPSASVCKLIGFPKGSCAWIDIDAIYIEFDFVSYLTQVSAR